MDDRRGSEGRSEKKVWPAVAFSCTDATPDCAYMQTEKFLFNNNYESTHEQHHRRYPELKKYKWAHNRKDASFPPKLKKSLSTLPPAMNFSLVFTSENCSAHAMRRRSQKRKLGRKEGRNGRGLVQLQFYWFRGNRKIEGIDRKLNSRFSYQIREERMAEYQRAFVEHQEQLKRLTEGDSSNSDNGNSSDSESESHGDEEWEGFAEPPAVDYEAEYIDEDKYTTVTVEAMDASKEALYRLQRDDDSDEEEDGQKGQSLEAVASSNGSSGKKKKTTNPDKVKKKKKQFRYESKEERKLALAKQRLAKKRKANARRER